MPHLPPQARAAIDDAGLVAAAHISPPAWARPSPDTWHPFAVARAEVRRRIAAADVDFFLRYREIGDGGVSEFRRVGGVRTNGSDALLEAPLSPLRAMVHRFRAWDAASDQSPCRH